jgi:hypothetical protein
MGAEANLDTSAQRATFDVMLMDWGVHGPGTLSLIHPTNQSPTFPRHAWASPLQSRLGFSAWTQVKPIEKRPQMTALCLPSVLGCKGGREFPAVNEERW